MFEKLLNSSDQLALSVTKIIHQAGLPVGNMNRKRKTNIVYD